MDCIAFIVCCCSTLTVVAGSLDRDGLMKRLLGQDLQSIPNPSEGKLLTVSVGLGLARAEIDEDRQVVTTNAWLRLMWKDYRLQWDPEEEAGIMSIHLPSQHLWTPDIALYHYSIEEPKFGKEPLVLVQPDGTVIYAPTLLIKADCTQNILGVYDCPLTFGSYTYDGHIMNLAYIFGRQTVDAEDFKITHGGWQVVGDRAEIDVKYYPCCPEVPQPIITFYTQFSREDKAQCS